MRVFTFDDAVAFGINVTSVIQVCDCASRDHIKQLHTEHILSGGVDHRRFTKYYNKEIVVVEDPRLRTMTQLAAVSHPLFEEVDQLLQQ